MGKKGGKKKQATNLADKEEVKAAVEEKVESLMKKEEQPIEEETKPEEKIEEKTQPEVKEEVQETKVEDTQDKQEPEEEKPKEEVNEAEEFKMNISATQQEPEEDKTESEVVAEKNVVEAPKEVNENYISKPEVGIKSFQKMQDEVQSPFRKRRGTLVKLKMQDTDDEDEDLDRQDAFKQIQPLFTSIELSFAEKKTQFETLKNSNTEERVEMYKKNELQDLRSNWLQTLELHIPESMTVEQKYVDQFKTKNQDTIKDIETFILILTDWLNNTIEEVKNSVPAEDANEEEVNIKRRISNIQLQSAEKQIQAQIQAQAEAEMLAKKQSSMKIDQQKKRDNAENEKLLSQLESLEHDDDLMKGLDDMEKKEQEQLNTIKQQFTPRDAKAPTKTSPPPVNNQVRQGEQQAAETKPAAAAAPIVQAKTEGTNNNTDQKPQQDQDDGFMSKVVIGVALLAIVGGVVYKQILSK